MKKVQRDSFIKKSSTEVDVKRWLFSLIQLSSDITRHDLKHTGGRLNKKDGLTRYGDSHVKDKTS